MRRPGRAVGGGDGGRAALQYVPVFYYSYKRPKGAEAMSFYFLVTVSKHHHCRSFSMLAWGLQLVGACLVLRYLAKNQTAGEDEW